MQMVAAYTTMLDTKRTLQWVQIKTKEKDTQFHLRGEHLEVVRLRSIRHKTQVKSMWWKRKEIKEVILLNIMSNSASNLPSCPCACGLVMWGKRSLAMEVLFNVSQKHYSKINFSFAVGLLNGEKSPKICCDQADSRVTLLFSPQRRAVNVKHKATSERRRWEVRYWVGPIDSCRWATHSHHIVLPLSPQCAVFLLLGGNPWHIHSMKLAWSADRQTPHGRFIVTHSWEQSIGTM